MPDSIPSPQAGLNKGATMILKYAPPLVGIAAGYITGDLFDISSYIMGSAVGQGAKTGQSGISYAGFHFVDAKKIVRLITAGIYAIIGIVLWNWLDGKWLGGLLGGFFVGIALRGVVGVMR